MSNNILSNTGSPSNKPELGKDELVRHFITSLQKGLPYRSIIEFESEFLKKRTQQSRHEYLKRLKDAVNQQVS